MFSFAAPTPSALKTPTVKGPFVATSAAAVSFDRDVRTLPPAGPVLRREFPERSRHKPGTIDRGPLKSRFTDTALQPLLPSAPMPSPNASFKGLDFTAWGAGWPPDTVGDVGPNHYIQAVNTSLGIFNKAGARLAAFTFDNFFSGTGTPCDDLNQGDPTVVYDPLADRFMVSDFAFALDTSNNPVGPFYQCFAVSKTGDPVAGGWWLYAILTDPTSFPDYPKLGVWPDGIYMSANIFDAGGSFTGTRVWAFNRTDLESGVAVRQIRFDVADTNSFALLPSNFRGTPPPAGRPNFFIWYQESFPQFTGSQLYIHKFSITNWSPPTATFSGPTAVNVSQYREAPYLAAYVPQLSGEAVDTLGDRFMMQNQYRNINGTESLWNMHTVIVPNSGPQTAIRWYQLNVTGGTIAAAPVQQSTFAPDTSYRWMGSLAIDRQGNMAVGYSVSSPSMFPGIRYAGRLITDPVNQLAQTETSLIEGAGSQAGGFNRWGDYSAMSVDPSDDCTFWYTQEYYEATGMNWQTRIGSFKFPSCTVPPVQLNSVVSRKMHGNLGPFDIALPLVGGPGIECRSGGQTKDHTLVFTFANPLTTVGGASVSSGSVSGSAIGSDTHQYVVNLTGIEDAQVITVNLINVADSAGHNSSSVSISMGVLLGDVNGDGFVLSGDYTATRQRSGASVDGNTFIFDVNVDGLILSGDYTAVRQQSGMHLP